MTFVTVQTSPPVVQDPRLVELGINVIRGIAMDVPEEAHSGHTGTAMALAPLAHVLWTRIMQYDPLDPHWPDRDRFVLSCGHACILQYAMLHLTGYDLSLEDLRQFREWGSRTPGHPENRDTPGIEVTTGPLGQGLANAVGMALAERWLRTTFGSDVCDHRTFVIAGDGCMMEGVSHESASLAGHLGLGRLFAFYDDNHITIDGPTELAYNDDPVKRFEAYGWRVHYLGEIANDVDALEAAIREVLEYTSDTPDAKPNLLVLRSHIGWPSPHLTDTNKAHGDPFGPDEIRLTKEILGLPTDQTFWVPDEVREFYELEVARGAKHRAEWTARFEAWDGDRVTWDAAQAGHGLPGFADDLPTFEAGTQSATRHALNQCIDATVGRIPGLLAGSADLTGNNGVKVKGAEIQSKESPRRDPGALRHPRARYGRRDDRHGPARRHIAPGRHVLRLHRLHAARGAAGVPQRQPRHVLVDARLHRARPGRPDAPTGGAPDVAARHAGPQPHPTGRCLGDGTGLEARRRGERTRRPDPHPPEHPRAGRDGLPGGRRRQRGAYVLADADATPDIVLVGTGSEVQLCLGAAPTLASEGIRARVVSFPSWDLFARQPADYRADVFPPGVPVLSVEAGATLGWERYADDSIGLDRFGASAPGDVVMEKLGFTTEHVVERAARAAGQPPGLTRRREGRTVR